MPGTGKKIIRTVSGGKPKVDAPALLAACERGDITREEYLSLTSMPECPRVFDPLKASKAIKADPSLLFKLSKAATPTRPVTAIKVVKDS